MYDRKENEGLQGIDKLSWKAVIYVTNNLSAMSETCSH